MKHKFLVLGGDLRSIRLAQMLSDDDNKVFSFGQERSDEIIDNSMIERCNSLKIGLDKAQIIVAPVPFSNNGENINTPFSDEKIKIEDLLKANKGKLLIGGNISEEIRKKLSER